MRLSIRIQISNYFWFLSLWTRIWERRLRKFLIPIYKLLSRWGEFLLNQFLISNLRDVYFNNWKELITAIRREWFIEIWSLRIFWWIEMEYWRWQILVYHEPSASHWSPLPKTLWLYGTVLLRFCWALRNTQSRLISGQLAVFLQRWLSGSPCSWESPRLTRSTRYFLCWGHLMKVAGPVFLIYPTTN